MLRRFSINFALFSMLFDGLAVAASLWLATYFRPMLNRFEWVTPITTSVVIPSILYVIFPLIWVVIYSILSIYDGRKYLRATDEFSGLSLAMLIASVSAAGVLYISYREVSRTLFLLFVVIAYLFSILWRVAVRVYFRSQTKIATAQRRVLIVGAGTLGQKIKTQFSEIETNEFTFVGFIDEASNGQFDSNLLLGGLNNIREVIQRFQVTDVVIALPHSAYTQLGRIVLSIEDIPIQVWVALGFFDLALYKTNIEDFAGVPMLDLRSSAIDDYQRMLKRAFDILFGTLALIGALPLMAISMGLIFAEDGLPVLFRQKRVGENGKIFEMLKFRTMLKNAEQLQDQVERRDENGNLIHKTKEDWRVTRVGRFLRRFSLDELPQFVNVVRGDMSLVGPRPELPALVDRYQPWQRKRFAIPPGITGWWQVSGRSDKPMHLHTEDDLYYIQNYSILLDIQILIKTIWVVIVGKGSY
jgi:exopolysaccharide biosynthesis polyprenyl glycosylphosphotransferase